MGKPAHLSGSFPIPPVEPPTPPNLDDAIRRAVIAATTTVIESLHSDDNNNKPAPRHSRALVAAMVMIVLLGGALAYTMYRWDRETQSVHRKAQAEQAAKDKRDVLGAIETIQRNMVKVQSSLNALWTRVVGDDARPQELEPIADAVTNGTGRPP